MAAAEHHKCQGCLQTTLQHARNAGEWFNEAKARLGHRSKWGKWKRWFVRTHCIGARTISQYMQIHRHWDDPRIVALRTEGFGIESIQGFLNVLRGKHPKATTPPTEKEKEMDDQRKLIRRVFAAHVRALDAFELKVLAMTLDRRMERFNEELRETVCVVLEEDYYQVGGPKWLANEQRERKAVVRSIAGTPASARRKLQRLPKPKPQLKSEKAMAKEDLEAKREIRHSRRRTRYGTAMP